MNIPEFNVDELLQQLRDWVRRSNLTHLPSHLTIDEARPIVLKNILSLEPQEVVTIYKFFTYLLNYTLFYKSNEGFALKDKRIFLDYISLLKLKGIEITDYNQLTWDTIYMENKSWELMQALFNILGKNMTDFSAIAPAFYKGKSLSESLDSFFNEDLRQIAQIFYKVGLLNEDMSLNLAYFEAVSLSIGKIDISAYQE